MEKEATINSLFGETIYCTNVDNDNQTIAKHIESFVKEKPGRTAATTDVKGIATNINAFLKAKGYSKEKFDAHITKSWATYTVKDQHIASHKHTASHFSFVYYVRNDGMGNIRFEKELAAQTGLFIPPTDQYIVDWNQFNFSSYIFPVKTGNFVIFPSGLLHYTEVNTKEEARISISGDVLLTMKPGVKTEHCIPHPSGWDTISN
jgi:uncharacterized protein (TIGR02466 family)